VSKPINIIIVETSSLIPEGLSAILLKSGIPVHLLRAGNLGETEKFLVTHKKNIVIINPSLIQNNIKLFNSMKTDYPDANWIAVLYAFYDPQMVALFDGVINIYDSPEIIISLIKKTINSNPGAEPVRAEEILSERETEVLQLLATGLANKAIADKLNISINTVITHRKNISQKTGIKSISGLTIYAVVKKLISIDNVN
jgi:DNA-binding NarL/FixJ family response regulator